MFKPASFFIGLRYTRAKRRNHFISFISLVSMIGIALGITALITVLSVMNGFDREIKKRIFSMVPAFTVTSPRGNIMNWEAAQKLALTLPYITAAAPYVNGEVLLNYGSSTQPAIMSGILPAEEKNISELSEKMVQGKLSDLHAGEFGIILGEHLANLLGATLGDKITAVTPQVSMTPAGIIPRYKRFTIVGIFSAGAGFGFDRGLGFIHLNDAQKLLGLGNNVSGLHLNTNEVFRAPELAKTMTQQLTGASISTWADQFGEFFRAIQLEKTMMFLILLLIIAVAAFNLVSTLMMVVSEKESDIAILRTIGATPRTIMAIFIVQGAVVGFFGTLLGLFGGILLALNATEIVQWMESTFHVQFLSSNVYFVNYLPSHIEATDVIEICVISILLSLLATIYPAWRASKMDPVESLRYE